MDFDKFKSLLNEEMTWPDYYQFKFVIKSERKQELIAKLPGHKIAEKESSGGKYTSISGRKIFQNADEVIEVYKEVSEVKGVITL